MVNEIKRDCIVCGKQFFVKGKQNKLTCSEECSKINKKRLHQEANIRYKNSIKNRHVCLFCSKPFQSKRKTQKYCSKECAALAVQNYKTCVICGKVFPCPPNRKTIKTCSAVCASINKKKPKTSPKIGKFDTNASAKHWILQSPNGTVYECRNLVNWVRKNYFLFGIEQDEEEIQRVTRQFYRNKRLKSKNTTLVNQQHKGWQVIGGDDFKKIIK